MYTYFATGLLFFTLPFISFAAGPSVYTNENILVSEHDTPTFFELDGSGGFYGYTGTGKYFTQTPVTNSEGIRIQKFEIDQAFFYVTDKGVLFAQSDLAALSLYLLT